MSMGVQQREQRLLLVTATKGEGQRTLTLAPRHADEILSEHDTATYRWFCRRSGCGARSPADGLIVRPRSNTDSFHSKLHDYPARRREFREDSSSGDAGSAERYPHPVGLIIDR